MDGWMNKKWISKQANKWKISKNFKQVVVAMAISIVNQSNQENE